MLLFRSAAGRGATLLFAAPRLAPAWPMDDLDELWADLLSADSVHIRRAWGLLSAEERQAVREHLARMRDEDGWHPAQREAALAAIRLLRDLDPTFPTQT